MKKAKQKNTVNHDPSASSQLFELKHTAAATPKKAGTLQHSAWNEVEVESVNPLLERQLVVGNDVMLARILLRKGCLIPLHSHVNEQLSYILEGALKFSIAGREIVVRAGEVLTIPPNMPHKAEALEDTIDLDIFHPPRADWLNRTDQYLRSK
ncbi:MAG: cupin domain-containing protein [Acidobacteria bacterium]|nr:cupin domain-containing protein [Acidobacteriota bacterium]MBV9626038.1 cupin domain-containing protein [Acidobacteriota bacterium]